MGGDGDVELIKKLLLLWRGLRHTPEPDLTTVGRRQDDVRALQRGEECEGPRGREAGPAPVQQMFQRDPQRVPKKRNQQMGLHAPLKVMEDRTNGELAFQ